MGHTTVESRSQAFHPASGAALLVAGVLATLAAVLSLSPARPVQP